MEAPRRFLPRVLPVLLISLGALCAVPTASGAFRVSQEPPSAFPVVDPEVWAEFNASSEVYLIVLLRSLDLGSTSTLEERQAAVRAVQEGALVQLSSDEFRLAYQYRNIPAVTGWASQAALSDLAAMPEVERVGLDSIERSELGGSVPFIKADQVQAIGFTGEGVTVAVLDGGIDTDHPDLSDDLASGAWHFLDQGANTGPGAEDDTGHGTHVSGIITSKGAAASVGVAPEGIPGNRATWDWCSSDRTLEEARCARVATPMSRSSRS